MDMRLKRQQIVIKDGFKQWETVFEDVRIPPEQAAVVIVDMWDRHWARGCTERCAEMAPRIDAAVRRARERGVLIVHAASDVESFYEGTPARERLLSVPVLENIPEPVTIADYPLPIDDSDAGSDTVDDAFAPNTNVWTRQTDRIFIDPDRDVLCGDEGDRLFSYLKARGIRLLFYMGVATNMCVLHRSFGIKRMLRRGMKTVLVGDLTDAMYNPERPPYVSHWEGTRLAVEFIEKKYCPTIGSEQL